MFIAAKRELQLFKDKLHLVVTSKVHSSSREQNTCTNLGFFFFFKNNLSLASVIFVGLYYYGAMYWIPFAIGLAS